MAAAEADHSTADVPAQRRAPARSPLRIELPQLVLTPVEGHAEGEPATEGEDNQRSEAEAAAAAAADREAEVEVAVAAAAEAEARARAGAGWSRSDRLGGCDPEP